MKLNLQGKAVLITGASNGIGKQSAKQFAKEGASVFLTGRNEAALKEVCAEITANGGTASYLAADLSDAKAADALVAKTVEVFGKLDILVCSAGMALNDQGTMGSRDGCQSDGTVIVVAMRHPSIPGTGTRRQDRLRFFYGRKEYQPRRFPVLRGIQSRIIVSGAAFCQRIRQRSNLCQRRLPGTGRYGNHQNLDPGTPCERIKKSSVRPHGHSGRYCESHLIPFQQRQ